VDRLAGEPIERERLGVSGEPLGKGLGHGLSRGTKPAAGSYTERDPRRAYVRTIPAQVSCGVVGAELACRLVAGTAKLCSSGDRRSA
jgi:hypothetical protein